MYWRDTAVILLTYSRYITYLQPLYYLLTAVILLTYSQHPQAGHFKPCFRVGAGYTIYSYTLFLYVQFIPTEENRLISCWYKLSIHLLHFHASQYCTKPVQKYRKRLKIGGVLFFLWKTFCVFAIFSITHTSMGFVNGLKKVRFLSFLKVFYHF